MVASLPWGLATAAGRRVGCCTGTALRGCVHVKICEWWLAIKNSWRVLGIRLGLKAFTVYLVDLCVVVIKRAGDRVEYGGAG